MRLLGMGRSTKRALVLGCGPAGLFAAHGLVQNGWAVSIYSKARKSHLFGAQYLHEPIPGLTPDDAKPVPLKYVLVGEADGYREKVYGVNQVTTSVEVLGQEHDAWDIRTTYDAAWEAYGHLVNDAVITPEFLGIRRVSPLPPNQPEEIAPPEFDIVVNSIPQPSLCYQQDLHQFHAINVWAMGDAPERGQYVPYHPARDNVVECNGERHTGWYRAARVFGYSTVEWPGNRKPPLPGVAEVTKPLYSTCDCYRNGGYPVPFIHVGRYGSWTKGVLSHQAYLTAVNL